MATANNLDATGTRLVRKGLTVTRDGVPGAGVVVRLLNGRCMVQWPCLQYPAPEQCNRLTVELPKPKLRYYHDVNLWRCKGHGVTTFWKTDAGAFNGWVRSYTHQQAARARRVRVINER